MAKHVDNVSDIWVPALSVAEFKAQLQHGDILMCSGQEEVSYAIRNATGSPWSHTGHVIEDSWYPEPLFIEAVIKYGVRISRLYANYVGPYNGDVVLCRRILPKEAHEAIIRKAVSRLGDGYDWQSEVEQLVHKFLPEAKEGETKGELYCSGLVQYASTAWDPPIHQPNPNVMPSPEDIWTDPTVLPVCKLLKGVK